MNEIISMMKFDFIALRKKSYRAYGIIFLILCAIAMISIPFMPIAVVFYSGFAVQPIFLMGVKSDFNKFYGTIPAKKSNIVIARFLLTFLTILTVGLLSYGATELISGISLAPMLGGGFEEAYLVYDDMKALSGTDFVPVTISLAMMISSLVIAIEFTMIYIFGPEKETIAAGAAVFLIVGIVYPVSKASDISYDNLLELFQDIFDKSKALYYCLTLGIDIVLFSIGAAVSSFFFSKKEF